MKPKVTIVIPTINPANQKYLDLAIKSIANLSYPKDRLDVICVSSGGFIPALPEFVKAITFTERKHFAEAVNVGFADAQDDSEHFLILSDDCVLTRNSLSNLITQATNRNVILGPISNCDNYARYNLSIGYRTSDGFTQFEKRFYRYEETVGHHEQMMNADSVYSSGNILVDYHCFYSVLIPRKVWNMVGSLDERFKSGQEDVDYCARARRMGVSVEISLDALIWHFGGVTADVMMDQQTRTENIAKFKEKWGNVITL